MNICIDTDVFIDFLRGQKLAKDFLSQMIKNADAIYFSAITEAELLSGQSCNESKTRELVISLLNSFTKIEVDNPIAQLAGYIRRTHATPLPDAIIAATALKMDALLYSKNSKDYMPIPDLLFENPY